MSSVPDCTINQKIIMSLTYLKILRDLQKNSHSAKALEKVVDNIKSIRIQILSGEHVKTLTSGVGKTTIGYINDIIRNMDPNRCGIVEIDNLDYQSKERLVAICEFVKVPGIGTVTAYDYYNGGIRNIDQLRSYLSGGNGTTRQQIGITYMEEFERRIPRIRITNFLSVLNQRLIEYNNHNRCHLNYDICGSYLRGKETSGDLDFILWSIFPNEISIYATNFLDYLRHVNLLKETLSQGVDVYQGILYLDEEFPSVRIDIKILNDINGYYYSLLYFTGSGELNQRMRDKAMELGYKLGNDEMIIRSTNVKVYVRSEQDIFNLLGMEWISPTER